jgi:hypothetical protein
MSFRFHWAIEGVVRTKVEACDLADDTVRLREVDLGRARKRLTASATLSSGSRTR